MAQWTTFACRDSEVAWKFVYFFFFKENKPSTILLPVYNYLLTCSAKKFPQIIFWWVKSHLLGNLNSIDSRLPTFEGMSLGITAMQTWLFGMGESLAKLCSHPKVSLLDLHDFNIRYKVSIRCWLILPLVSLLVVVSWNLVVLLMYDRAGDSKGGNLSHRHPYSQFQHRSFPSLGSHFCCGGFPALSGNTCVSIGL